MMPTDISPDRHAALSAVDASRVALRPVTPMDEAFLRAVYASTREDELRLTEWDNATKDAFLRMQFDAQRRSYLERFPRASYEIILCDEKPVGRLIVDRGADAMRILDIAIIPDARGVGIGTITLSRLIDEAAGAGVPVRIHVEQENRALRLYDRLGFRVIHEVGLYFLLERPVRADCASLA